MQPKILISAVALLVSLAGCATNVTRPISEANRDPSGAFDGRWQANVRSSPARQYGPGNWVFNCSGKPQQFAFVINSSEASVNYQEKAHKTFVNKDGQFRFEIPMNVNTSASGTSDSSIDRGKMTMIIVGALDANAGHITYGIEQFANQGCTAKIDYARSS